MLLLPLLLLVVLASGAVLRNTSTVVDPVFGDIQVTMAWDDATPAEASTYIAGSPPRSRLQNRKMQMNKLNILNSTSLLRHWPA